ncbi:hypothetical protein [Slackia exigua]|uniref:DivIVA domain protein n=1 Tax=Slackia exigua (strain ATCC 700122 / DSM 15923 / CIP 105133 / JCM 11022 / KCTC 5966 / S-7) TaxID=649764 RepID=D0WH66_SLAES|nr:hypothetical protein [Slackia exigua]EEZ61030.1 hypothetical protein HMPREF0762_01098 [Slackia exigua ATCC 700122]STN99343.1 Uncharacterised protein [Slackia exigua]
MPLPESVAAYVSTITFKKKALGGIDEVDALEKIADICRLYEAEFGEAAHADATHAGTAHADAGDAQVSEGAQASEPSEEARNGRIAELEAEKAAIMAASNELAAQVTSLQQEVENLRAERGDLDEIRQEYERRYDEIKELSQFLPRIKEDQEARARREADVLISDARNKAQEIQVSALAERDRIDEDISRLEAARNELLVSTQKTLLVHERALARFKEKIGPLDAGE